MSVKIWTLTPNYEVKLSKVLLGHQKWVWDACFSADSAYLVTGARYLISRDPTVHQSISFE